MKLKWYEISYLFLFVSIVITVSIIFSISFFSTFSTILGIFAAFFNTKVNRICYIFYLSSAVLYCIVSFMNKIYGEAILYLLYTIPIYTLAFYNNFIKIKKANNDQYINSIETKKIFIIFIVITVIAIIYGYILHLIDSVLPYLNALATGLAIFASYFASKRIKEQWLFWILNSLVLLFIWTYQSFSNIDALSFVILNIVYLFFNVIGIIKWSKLPLKKNQNI